MVVWGMGVNLRSIASASAAIAVGVFFLVWSLGWIHPGSSAPVAQVEAACADLTQGCQFVLNGKSFAVKSDRPINPAHPFTLILQGEPLKQASASWQMVGMEMGPNRFHFAATGSNQWQTQTALPFCTQARHDWQLTLNLDGNNVILTTQSR